MTSEVSRDFLAQRVFDMTKPRLIDKNSEKEIWQAVAETSDDELYAFYSRLVKERADDLRSRVLPLG